MANTVRSLSAFYPTRQAAQQASTAIVAAGVSSEAVTVSDGRGTVTGNSAASPREGTGILDTIKHAFAQDNHTYSDELGRDGFVLTAHVPEANYDEVLEIVRKEGKVSQKV